MEWTAFFEVLAEVAKQQDAVNVTVSDTLAGLQATDAALLTMLTHLWWTMIALGVMVGYLAGDRWWEKFKRRRVIDTKWH